MSETVHYRGVAKKIEIPEGKTLIDTARDILNMLGKTPIAIPSYYTDEVEYLTDIFDEEYFLHEKTQTLYKITKTSHDLDDEIIKANLRVDGVVEYELRYYNGGAGFHECLNEAMDKI